MFKKIFTFTKPKKTTPTIVVLPMGSEIVTDRQYKSFYYDYELGKLKQKLDFVSTCFQNCYDYLQLVKQEQIPLSQDIRRLAENVYLKDDPRYILEANQIEAMQAFQMALERMDRLMEKVLGVAHCLANSKPCLDLVAVELDQILKDIGGVMKYNKRNVMRHEKQKAMLLEIRQAMRAIRRHDKSPTSDKSSAGGSTVVMEDVYCPMSSVHEQKVAGIQTQ